jgi:hypothetical protein
MESAPGLSMTLWMQRSLFWCRGHGRRQRSDRSGSENQVVVVPPHMALDVKNRRAIAKDGLCRFFYGLTVVI